MKKGRDLLGLPIIENVTGQRLGEVEDLVYQPGKFKISGFLIDKGNWIHSAKQVSVETAPIVAVTGIKVATAKVLKAKGSHLVSTLQGKKVKTAGGKLLGTVQDVLLDDTCTAITGLEISDGFISDIVSGRAEISRGGIVKLSKDAVIVENALEKIWEKQS